MNLHIRRFAVFLLLLLPCLYGAAGAQSYNDKFPPYTLANTEQRILHSESNGVTYKLYVSMPPGHAAEQGERYPVVYLLDADYSFAIGKNVTDHLTERGDLPPVILVGIAYAGKNQYRINRTRDYTPTHTPEGGYSREIQEVSGGAPDFLEFLEDELFPFVESAFPAGDQRIITGHSFGGLFVSWALLQRPDLFDGYIAVSPSLWYDDHLLFEMEKRSLGQLGDAEAQLYFTVGDQEINNQWNMPQDLRRFAERLVSRNHPRLSLRWEIAEEETHNSIFPTGFSRGIRFVLNGEL